jgi:molybdopterin molybdotransferase
VEFWKVAIKPGKPFACGQLTRAPRGSWFFGLPGNPVSALVTFVLLVRPALEQLMGKEAKRPLRLSARLAMPVRLSPGRIDFQRGIASMADDGQLQVVSAGGQGSAMFSALSRANCLIRLDPEQHPGERELAAGTCVEIQLFDEVLQ